MPASSSESSPDSLEQAIGYTFASRHLSLEALTHRTYSHEYPEGSPAFNERLEFLGDAVLGLLVSEELFRRCPDQSEGHLSRRKAALVRDRTLARVASRIGLGQYLRLGRGEEQSGGRKRTSLLADALEALLAAVYLDGGLEAARGVLGRLFSEEFHGNVCEQGLDDPKTQLQELSHRRYQSGPEYTILEERGPDHAKVFHVEVLVGGTHRGRGTGRNRKEAEQQAARTVLESLVDAEET